MNSQLLPLLILIPILGLIGCVLTPRKWERTIFYIAISALFAELAAYLFLGYRWLSMSHLPVAAHLSSGRVSHLLSLTFYFDKIGAVFLGMATIITILIFIFSRYYMHRERGFKRFYGTVLLFFVGLVQIILAGNFEMLFIGWEFIGISSILLIAFYRDRLLPARNALKVFAVYRIADAFLLAAIWYAHRLFGNDGNFSAIPAIIAQHGNELAWLGLLLLMAALVKSALFPFSYWLPRALEGPTTSSAIFYGALSVHMGVFLLLRTYPLWQGSHWLRIVVALVGLVTALVASSTARVQSSIKTQIAYASITQIALMFIEVAAGLQWLALLHFVSNACLRTYQLLISPSIVSYLVHDQFFYFVPPAQKIGNTWLGKIRGTIFVLSLKEWNMNTAVTHYLWNPLKSLGRRFKFLDKPAAQVLSLLLFLLATKIARSTTTSTSAVLVISTAAAIASIVFYIRAYSTKRAAATCWNLIMLGHLFGALFLAAASVWNWKYLAAYGGGVVAAFLAGHVCLGYLRAKGEASTLRENQGVINVFPKLGNLFFVVSLFFMAFPISISFLAEDTLLGLIPGRHAFQIPLFCLAYLLAGVSIMRLYTKVFFGPHKTSYHEIAYKSS